MGYGEDSDLSRKGGDPLVSIGAMLSQDWIGSVLKVHDSSRLGIEQTSLYAFGCQSSFDGTASITQSL